MSINSGGSQVPILRARAEWWRRSWFVNFAMGFLFAAAMAFCVEPTASGKFPPAILLGTLCGFVALYIADNQFEKRLPGFKSSVFWKTIGGVVGMIIIAPLAFTPKSGCWSWDNRCPPAQHGQATHGHR